MEDEDDNYTDCSECTLNGPQGSDKETNENWRPEEE